MATASLYTVERQLARQTRERFIADATRALAEVCEMVQAHMATLMDQPANLREMQTRRDNWMLFQQRRNAWREATANAWQKALLPQAAASRPKQGEAKFELLGNEVMENKIQASRLALGVMEKVASDFEDLRVRVEKLEGEDLSANDILRLDVLILAMVEQWAAAGLSMDAWQAEAEGLQRLLTEHLKKAYQACNQFLIGRNVLPQIELQARVKRAPSEPGARGAGQGVDSGHHDSGSSGGGSLRGAVGNMLRGRGPANAHLSASEETRMMTGTTPLARARMRAQGVLGQLKRLLIDQVGGDFEMTAHQKASPALARAIAPGAIRDRLQRTAEAGGTVVDDHGVAITVGQAAELLRDRTAELKKKASTDSEKATIEIVALMFQSILAEERIPSAVRVWFARLQLPVLRVALAEPEFFGTLDHPARQLIDRMGSCVMGFDASAISGSALEAEIRRVVQVIEQYPETGKRVFQLVYDEFQKFLSKFLTEKSATQRVVSVAQQVEQKETLAIQYTIELRNLLKDIPVRDEIRDFLFKIWAEVLALAAIRHGAQHADTVALKRAASDLVWAASAKPNRADRARVIQDLPQLLQRLRQGMGLLGVQGDQQEAQIKIISDTLADAFLSKTAAIPQARIEAMAKRLANLEDFVDDEEGLGDLPLDAETIELMLGIDASSINVVADGGSRPSDAMLAWALELQVGNWFTLEHNGAVKAVQFVWRSDRKQLHLFASMDGSSYLIQIRRLAAYLQAGLLLPQEEEALTLRATRSALEKIDANPERLLAA